MTVPAYEAYRDSGVEWLGEIPSHWPVVAIGYRYEVALGKMLDEKRITGELLGPYLRNVDVQWDQINVDELPQMDFSTADADRYSLSPGDLLVCEGGEVGRAAIWQGALERCFYQKALHRLRPRERNAEIPRFMYYLLRAASDQAVFTAGSGKATIAHLPAEAFRRFRFPFPTRPEQSAIAAFLDRETAKIDALVEEQRRLVELLNEKRQAVISHAVTKGLDPTVPMKDSGVEWLGEVPAHWGVKPFRHVLSRIESGTSVNASDVPASQGELGVLKTSCVYSGEFEPGENKTVIVEELDRVSCPVQSGTLIVSRMNTPDLVGAAGLVRKPAENLFLPDRLWQLHFDGAAAAFAHYWTQTRSYRGQVQVACAGTSSSMQNLSQDQLRSFAFPCPPPDEQAKIVRELDRELERQDQLATQAEAAISLLQERRTALISAAVTGKIDVRGLVPAEAEAA